MVVLDTDADGWTHEVYLRCLEEGNNIQDYFRASSEEWSTDLSRMKGFHRPVFRLPRLVQLGAVNDDDAAIRVGYEGELVVGIAGVERDVVEKGGRPGQLFSHLKTLSSRQRLEFRYSELKLKHTLPKLKTVS